MNVHHPHRVPRLLAALLVAAAVAAPVAAADGGQATLLNDVAHYGVQTPATPADPTLRNDVAHNTTRPAPADELPAAIVVQVGGGFDWISAGVGAAGAFGLLLVLGAATTGLRRRSATA